jgi:hypothetical protein
VHQCNTSVSFERGAWRDGRICQCHLSCRNALPKIQRILARLLVKDPCARCVEHSQFTNPMRQDGAPLVCTVGSLCVSGPRRKASSLPRALTCPAVLFRLTRRHTACSQGVSVTVGQPLAIETAHADDVAAPTCCPWTQHGHIDQLGRLRHDAYFSGRMFHHEYTATTSPKATHLIAVLPSAVCCPAGLFYGCCFYQQFPRAAEHSPRPHGPRSVIPYEPRIPSAGAGLFSCRRSP